MGKLSASIFSWYAFARCHGNSKLRSYFLLFLLKKLLLSFPQFGACKLSLWNWNVDLLTYTGQFYRLFNNATSLLWESKSFWQESSNGLQFWEILVIMAVIAVIFFQFPKKDFFDVLQHTNTMRYSLHSFRCTWSIRLRCYRRSCYHGENSLWNIVSSSSFAEVSSVELKTVTSSLRH